MPTPVIDNECKLAGNGVVIPQELTKQATYSLEDDDKEFADTEQNYKQKYSIEEEYGTDFMAAKKTKSQVGAAFKQNVTQPKLHKRSKSLGNPDQLVKKESNEEQ